MKRSTLNFVNCPNCHAELVLRAAGGNGAVETGSLFCAECESDFAIVNGIVHFIRLEELSGLNRRFARLYDWFSYVYRPFSRIGLAFLGGEDRNRREIIDRLELTGRVLEVSIGPGVNLPYLVGAPGVSEVYGLDISLGQLRRCRSYCRRKGWAVDLFLGNAEDLPFKDNSFDVVFHVGGINFFDNKQKAIEEMIRVARPGAKIVVADETEKGARGYERLLPGFSRAFDGRREAVEAPVDLVPPAMAEIRLDLAWRGWFYCLEFRKPKEKAVVG